MLLADHQQGSQDPLLSGLVCMHTLCGSLQIGCSRTPWAAAPAIRDTSFSQLSHSPCLLIPPWRPVV